MLKTGFMKLAGHRNDDRRRRRSPSLSSIIDEKRLPRQTGIVTKLSCPGNDLPLLGTVGGAIRDFPPPAPRTPQASGLSAQVTASQTAASTAAPMKTVPAPECDATQPPSAPPVNRPAAWAVL